jgi:Flp pilus assembly protein TadG
MSPASTRRYRRVLGQSGTASLEFALVSLPFLLILIAGMDLGRYFLTQHSLRTLISVATRSALIYCYGASGVCTLTTPLAQTAETKVPFLTAGSITWPSGLPTQTAPNPGTGVRTITVTARYPFTFILPVWTGLNGPITETTSMQY